MDYISPIYFFYSLQSNQFPTPLIFSSGISTTRFARSVRSLRLLKGRLARVRRSRTSATRPRPAPLVLVPFLGRSVRSPCAAGVACAFVPGLGGEPSAVSLCVWQVVGGSLFGVCVAPLRTLCPRPTGGSLPLVAPALLRAPALPLPPVGRGGCPPPPRPAMRVPFSAPRSRALLSLLRRSCGAFPASFLAARFPCPGVSANLSGPPASLLSSLLRSGLSFSAPFAVGRAGGCASRPLWGARRGKVRAFGREELLPTAPVIKRPALTRSVDQDRGVPPLFFSSATPSVPVGSALSAPPPAPQCPDVLCSFSRAPSGLGDPSFFLPQTSAPLVRFAPQSHRHNPFFSRQPLKVIHIPCGKRVQNPYPQDFGMRDFVDNSEFSTTYPHSMPFWQLDISPCLYYP